MYPSHHQPSDQPCSEPFWQAMRYLSGELSAEEAAAFEAALADDLVAAEALSRAVLLRESLAVCAAEMHGPAEVPVVPVSARLPAAAVTRRIGDWRQRAVVRRAGYAMAATLSAAVLFAVGWFGRGALGLRSPSGFELTTTTGAREAAEPAEGQVLLDPLLSAWILLADDEPVPVEEAVFDFGVDPLELVESSERGVPSWMIAALLTSTDPALSPETLPEVHDPEREEL
jgi:hypothetical protein